MKSKITDIYKGYFQKSRVFLYPILGISKGSFDPIKTYISWEDEFNIGDIKLLCKYHNRDDMEFQIFEEKKLLGSPLFNDCRELEDDTMLYIFDLEDYTEDWLNFISGKYSQLGSDVKKAIRDHYGIKSPNYAFIGTYLYPEKHYDTYAKFLTVNPNDYQDMLKLIESVGELCDKPNFKKEHLKINVKTLEKSKI